jgi:hypothetical protein
MMFMKMAAKRRSVTFKFPGTVRPTGQRQEASRIS